MFILSHLSSYVNSFRELHGTVYSVRIDQEELDALSGYKKDIALSALGKSCIGGKSGFSHFTASEGYGKRQDSPKEFRERFAKNVSRTNALVFDSGKGCKAYKQGQ